MKTDSDIKRDVEAELRWDPDIDPTDIAVAVKSGVVTLTGFVNSYSQKHQAELDVKRVSGVVGVANDITVRLPSGADGSDPEIARDAVAALKADLPYSSANIKVVAKNGWLSLEGNVEWNYQRTRARTRCCGSKASRASATCLSSSPAWLPPRSGARSRMPFAATPSSMPTASPSKPTAAR